MTFVTGTKLLFCLRLPRVLFDMMVSNLWHYFTEGKHSIDSNILNVIHSSATTIEEKFRVLETRDKLIRSKWKKSHDGPTIGTCPDMCPEKERLLRVIQHQVAFYEQKFKEKDMDPKLAVKQYSRSSADQETPLPYELRSVEALEMTMEYLIYCIMDLCDDDDVILGEWYHFLWDRTRGVRKDITQQELCSQNAVSLVEYCVRFHIFCAARLVAEDSSIFDQKINTENLTKCLQTLKYMYQDLWRERQEICPNEAEFRAYIIMLNLNNGNFMWELQDLRAEIQNSPQVKFALNIYSALNTNNYVKFFKLVQKTTFLNAGLLMRYFIQVRTTALMILLKCYAPRVTTAQVSLAEVTSTLAFEDEESALDFFAHFAIHPNANGTHLIFDRTLYQSPDYTYNLERAHHLVESKRRSYSVAQIISNKTDSKLNPLIYELHTPENSFDEYGCLKLHTTEPDEIGMEFVEEDSLEAVDVVDQPKQLSPRIEIFEDIIVQPSHENDKDMDEAMDQESDDVLDEEESEKSPEKTAFVLVPMPTEDFQERSPSPLLVIESSIEQLEQSPEKTVVSSPPKERIENIKLTLSIDNVIEIRRKCREKNARKQLRRWYKITKMHRQYRHHLHNFALPQAFTQNQIAERLQFRGEALGNRLRYQTGHAYRIEVLPTDEYDLNRLYEKILNALEQNMLRVQKKISKHLYFKCLISLPELRTIQLIYDRMFDWKIDENHQITCTTTQYKSLYCCLEKSIRNVPMGKFDSNGIIFLVQDERDLHERLRCYQNGIGRCVRTPIAVICLTTDENFTDELKLEETYDFVSVYGFYTRENLEEAFVFLAENQMEPPPLQLDQFSRFLEENYVKNVWQNMAIFYRSNSDFQQFLTVPQHVIKFSRDALDRLKHLLLNPLNAEWQQFPQVLFSMLDQDTVLPCDYKRIPAGIFDKRNQDALEDLLNALYLPNLDQENDLKGYCCKYLKKGDEFYTEKLANYKSPGWMDVIQDLLMEKLLELRADQMIVYNEKDLRDFLDMRWLYYQLETTAKSGIDYDVIDRQRVDTSELNLNEMYRKLCSYKDLNRNGEKRNLIDQCMKISEDLDSSLQITKLILSRSKDLLSVVLNRQ